MITSRRRFLFVRMTHIGLTAENAARLIPQPKPIDTQRAAGSNTKTLSPRSPIETCPMSDPAFTDDELLAYLDEMLPVERMTVLEESLEKAGVHAKVSCRHLYHDREEVTVHVRLRD